MLRSSCKLAPAAAAAKPSYRQWRGANITMLQSIALNGSAHAATVALKCLLSLVFATTLCPQTCLLDVCAPMSRNAGIAECSRFARRSERVLTDPTAKHAPAKFDISAFSRQRMLSQGFSESLVRDAVRVQQVDATLACSLLAGVWNSKVFRGRWLRRSAILSNSDCV